MNLVRRRAFALALALVALLPVSRAAAQWASLGEMPAPKRERATLVFQNSQGTVAVSALTPQVVRVRFAPGPSLGRDHSYAILTPPAGDTAAQVEVGATASVLRTSALRVTLAHAPFRIAFASADGASLDEDDPARGMAFAGRTTRVWKRLRDDEHVYGLGEKTGELDKRGRYRGGYAYAMWNSDTYAYGDDTDPLYVSVPFYIVLRQGRAHGIFLDNTFRTSFDIGRTDPGLLAFGAVDGALDYYFIDGPTPKDVVQRYTELTGRIPLPPMWALGYQQSRYSYYPEARVRNLADTFRLKRVPADVLWLDIHYEDGYNPFTWDRERFPDPARMVRDRKGQGFHVVPIVDPHPKAQPGWALYESGLAADAFVKNPDGSVYKAPVWPSQGEKNPGLSVFPDFTKPSARKWWGDQLKGPYVDVGVAGIWNDMNEPAVFVEPTHTMDLDARHDGEGQPTDEREIHNVYGMLNSRATFEGLSRLRPDERPFVLTRATYAGGQRWSAVWPGDNVSDWFALRATIPMFANMGLSGFSFIGADIGGFAEVPSAELFTRWLQTGVFYPFMRTHTTFGTPDQEPGRTGRGSRKSTAAPSRCATSSCPRSTRSWRRRAGRACPRCVRSCSNIRTTPQPTSVRTSSCSAATSWSRPCCAKARPSARSTCPAAPGTNTRDNGGTKADARSRCPSPWTPSPCSCAEARSCSGSPSSSTRGRWRARPCACSSPPPTPPTVPNTKTTGTASPTSAARPSAGGSPRGPKVDGGPCRQRRRKARTVRPHATSRWRCAGWWSRSR